MSKVVPIDAFLCNLNDLGKRLLHLYIRKDEI